MKASSAPWELPCPSAVPAETSAPSACRAPVSADPAVSAVVRSPPAARTGEGAQRCRARDSKRHRERQRHRQRTGTRRGTRRCEEQGPVCRTGALMENREHEAQGGRKGAGTRDEKKDGEKDVKMNGKKDGKKNGKKDWRLRICWDMLGLHGTKRQGRGLVGSGRRRDRPGQARTENRTGAGRSGLQAGPGPRGCRPDVTYLCLCGCPVRASSSQGRSGWADWLPDQAR